MVAVGKRITPLPPHRSRRALLTHRAAGASAGPSGARSGLSGADPRCSRDAGALPRPHSRDCGSGTAPRPWSSSPARASRGAPRSSPPSWCCSGARPGAQPAMSSPTTGPGIEDGPRVSSGLSARPPTAPGPKAPGPKAPGPKAPAFDGSASDGLSGCVILDRNVSRPPVAVVARGGTYFEPCICSGP